MEKHFVEFLSPGTFVSESTVKDIAAWDVDAAKMMAGDIHERYGARPYGFRFLTRTRGPDDLDSKVSARSGIYYLGGTVRSLADVKRDNLPDEDILRFNMEANGYGRIVTNDNSWRFTAPLADDDVVLDFSFPATEDA